MQNKVNILTLDFLYFNSYENVSSNVNNIHFSEIVYVGGLRLLDTKRVNRIIDTKKQ